MPIVSVPLAGNLLQTSKNLSEFVDIIAFPAGSRAAPDKVAAKQALHMAQDWLTNITRWEYFLRRNASGTFTAGTAEYTIPERLNSVHNIRITSGNPRPLRPINEALYNRVMYNQSARGQAMHYHIQNKDQHSEIIFLPTPDSAETFQIDYYRDPAKENGLSNRLDIATWMELTLILYAQGLVALWKGRPDHVNFFRLANAEMSQAIGRDKTSEDSDIGFVASNDQSQYWPWDHPNYNRGDY